ncbi:MAG: aspartate--tRNA ligase [Acidobacteriota bacterium]
MRPADLWRRSFVKDPDATFYRDGTCASFSKREEGRDVRVTGWVGRRRDHGHLIFVDLRDRSGLLQIVFDAESSPEAHAQAETLRSEFVIAVKGKVVLRSPENVNRSLPTGEIEIRAASMAIFNPSRALPFPLDETGSASEELRLRYRFVDLRRPRFQATLRLRHKVLLAAREYLDSRGFLEIETPILTKPTPEGARDYLVPSRIHAGCFYALPQSPQIFKQILMVAGFDRYFQIARCFRDEDMRADRQAEFSQIDIEASFVNEGDIQEMVEGLVAGMFHAAGFHIETPFPRMNWKDSMARYGTDKPDLRFGMEIGDVTGIVGGKGFGVFDRAIEAGGVVRGLTWTGGADVPRSRLDALAEDMKAWGARGLVWIKVQPEEIISPVARFLGDETCSEAARSVGAGPGDLALFVADQEETVVRALGSLRLALAKRLDLIPPESESSPKFRFLWVTDFPLFEWHEEDGRYYARHHPFTSPVEEDVGRLREETASVRARAYDLVLNGAEIGGGSIRIHSCQVQDEVFSVLGVGPEEAENKFGFLRRALSFGAPPHGGIALGVERIIMALTAADSIRDVIAFPKTTSAADLMSGAPTSIEGDQLKDLSIEVVVPPRRDR